MPLSNICFPIHGSFAQNLALICPAVSEKSLILFQSVNKLGKRSRNDINLQNKPSLTQLVICSITFRSQAAIVFENPLFLLFPIKKACYKI